MAAAPHRSEAAVPATTDSNKWVVANSNNLRTATYEHREAKGRERGGRGEGEGEGRGTDSESTRST